MSNHLKLEISNKTQSALILIVAFFTSVVSVSFTAIFGSSLYLIAATGGFLFITLLLMKPESGIYVLLLASLLTAISVEVGPFTVRPDQVVTLIIAAALFFLALTRRRPFIVTTLDWLILAYLFLNVFSSLLHSPDVKTSIQKCALLSITFAAYFVSTQLILTQKTMSNLVSLLIVMGVLQAIYGIVSVFLFTKGIDIGGAHAPYGDIYARGTFLEGNIFGSFEMMVGLIVMSLLFSEHSRGRKGILLIALVVILVASLMSFTRAAWLGFLTGFAAYILFIRRELISRVFKHLSVGILVLVLVAGIGYGVAVSIKKENVSLLDIYKQRFQKILEYRSGTGSYRVKAWMESIRLWKRNPILGNGTDSIKALAVNTTMPRFGTEYWIPSSLLLALHDTGIAGLLCFIAIQLAFLWTLWIAMRRTKSLYHQAVLEGFFAAFVGAQFAYFFTNAFWLIFIWVFMAVGIACSRLATTGE